jgi:DNA invertase Pin-like site-specific DNA recombinase
MLAERAAMIEREFPDALHPMAHALAQLAETRKAGEKATESTPVMIRRAKAEGMKPADIARLLKVSESHVYAVLRKEPDETTSAVETFLADMTGVFEEHERETRAARRRAAREHGVEPDPDDDDQ